MQHFLIEKVVESKILDRLKFVYGEEQAALIFGSIEKLLSQYCIAPRQSGWSQRDAMLITYGDSILGDMPPLAALREFMRSKTGDLVSFIHLLPFYPFTSDDGFSVTDFRAVRDDLGSWDDITRLAEDYRLVFDGVINHVSASSHYMRGYQAGDLAYADFFLAMDPSADTSSVLRTRNLPLLHDYKTHEGNKWLWTTFSRDQIDLNYRNPKVLLEILDVLLFYAQQGAAMIRLDAIPYLWKEPGTSCSHLPQTHELIKLIRDVYDVVAPHVLLLTETNVPHRENITYFGDRGDEAQLIYNFALGPLILWSMLKGDARILCEWARGLELIGPRATYLNITATHDGIGMRPTEGILGHEERMELVQLAYDHGGDITGKRNSDGSVSPYELNLSYFDAINDPRADEPQELRVRRFMVSQSIPMALMGIPGIYFHSLLGSRNDCEGVKRTGRARSINRKQLFLAPLHGELADPHSVRAQVFSAYRKLLLLRSEQSAFHPDAAQEILEAGPALFAVRRTNAETGHTITALHNVANQSARMEMSEPNIDLITRERLDDGSVPLAPYQVRWLTPILE